MPSLTVATPGAFSFDECLRYLGRAANESLHTVADYGVRKVVQFGNTTVFLNVTAAPSGSLRVEYQTDHHLPTLAEAVRSYVVDWFDLARDLRPFYALAKQDTLLAPVVAQHYGLRLIGIPDLFEALCWAIIGQQINLTFAYTLKRRFVQTFGTAHTYEGLPYYLFPTPERMADCTPDQLTPLQFSVRKAEYIIGIAQAMTTGGLTKETLWALSEAEAQNALVSYRGVGAWTAHYVLLKCLRYPDAFPAQDVGLHNAIKHQLGLDQKPDLPAVHRYAEPWWGWRGYATFYLWQSLVADSNPL